MKPHDNAVIVSLPLSTDWASLIQRYKDEAKPDPLVIKQMQTWSFEWIPSSSSSDDYDDYDDDPEAAAAAAREESAPAPAAMREDATATTGNRSIASCYLLSGRLLWKGEYLQVTLRSRCRWDWDASRLDFACHASAAPRVFDNTSNDTNQEETNKKKNDASSSCPAANQRQRQRIIQ
jgi:hypothetical protein